MGRRGWALTVIGMLVVAAVALTAILPKSSGGNGKTSWDETTVSEGRGKQKIVQLFVEGTIAEQAGFSSSFSSKSFIKQLDQAQKDPDVKAVVIRVNSPGGEVVASDEIHNKIEEVKKSGKLIAVSMGSVAASGGYYISAGADFIYANPATLTGSLGVIFSVPNYEKAASLIGYKENTIKSGEFKDIGSPLREMTAKEKEIFQGLVNESYQQFVTVIEKGRKLPRDKVLAIADGRMYSGQQAKELGLIDGFGSLESATQYAKDKTGQPNARVVKYSDKFSLSSLFGGMQSKLKSPLSQLVEGFMPEVSLGPRLLYLYQ